MLYVSFMKRSPHTKGGATTLQAAVDRTTSGSFYQVLAKNQELKYLYIVWEELSPERRKEFLQLGRTLKRFEKEKRT